MKKWINKTITVVCLCLALSDAAAQSGLAAGEAVPNIPVKKILNSSSPLASSASFGDRLTVVDFFGTWCVPCLRALPHLTTLKERFRSELAVVLVSNETEEKLTKFIQARSNFSFPVIVDEDNAWNNRFGPPSLPYTVVLRGGKVLAITDAASLTEEAIKGWLTNSVAPAPSATTSAKAENKPSTMNTRQRSKNGLVAFSQDYIYAAKTGEALTTFTQNLASLSLDDLKTKLRTDNEKKAFWINLYNGYTQAALKAAPEKYKDRSAFFKEKALNIGGRSLSLDDIEHGILRRSKIKWSLGHLSKLFPPKWEKALRVDKVDYRIHFALNCGAKSCPPIAFYNDETLDAQLDLATKAYLTAEAEYDSAANTVRLPKLMAWFRADFGGKKGMYNILRQHGILAAGAKPKIEFKDYDWNLYLDNFKALQ